VSRPELPIPVLIADDGELHDVRALLEELAIPYACRDDKDSPEPDGVTPLLISTPQHTLALERGLWNASFASRIVVAESGMRALRSRLLAAPGDFVVERPVHPTALRVLILHCLYQGPERRRRDRVALGAQVKLAVGRRKLSVTLLELSLSGAGLLCSRQLRAGERVELVLPKTLVPAPFRLGARIRRSTPQEQGRFELGLAFEPMDAGRRRSLQQLMTDHAVGSAPLKAFEPRHRERRPELPTRTSAAAAGASAASASAGERRAGPRGRFRQSVLAGTRGAAVALVGRDLSVAGMRVAAAPELTPGDELKLALYGRGRASRILLKAVVDRDDGPQGLFLRFCNVSDAAAAKLRELIGTLPILASPPPGADRADRVVPSEIVVDDD
jgi:hypothetical protein